jgi:hypothetical protein
MINFLRGETSKNIGLFLLRFIFGYSFLFFAYSFAIEVPVGAGFLTGYLLIGLALFSIGGILFLLGLGTRFIALISFLYFQIFQLIGLRSLWVFPMTLLFFVPVLLGSGKYSLDYLISQRRTRVR